MPSNRNDGCPRLGNMIGRSADADDGDIATPFSSYLPIWFHPHLIAVLTGRQLCMTASNPAKSPKIMLKRTLYPFADAYKNVILDYGYVQHMYLYVAQLC